MVYKISFILLTLLSLCTSPKAAGTTEARSADTAYAHADTVVVGAERADEYIPALKDKRVALFSNHTGILPDGTHTLDMLRAKGVDVVCAFSPEHGFRGTADAGEHVDSSTDPATGIPVVSLFGPGRKSALQKAMAGVDAVVVDIQDVGLRYYTYYITMLEIMREAAREGKSVIVLDRPNPNGMTVDGPILDMKYASGVGQLPIPVVHGLTLGEMAGMIVGEGWLGDGLELDLTVVPCEGYTHSTRYRLPVAPSPNLKTTKAVYLYPSLCYFEATDVSVGRGTDKPFEIYGHPGMKNRDYSFTPRSMPGAKNPPQKDKLCHGVDLSSIDDETIIKGGINLGYLIDAYTDLKDTDKPFLGKFFELLIGDPGVRGMIESGATAEEIKATWADDVATFRKQRQPYLLYPE